ncbi:MAG: hypothetical protein EOP45_06800 [Sphingobacteriaceae bacterium]|nr:MAG: hypothetical protein EOP45_06800 [Sphingobacteriaceae bacterium]
MIKLNQKKLKKYLLHRHTICCDDAGKNMNYVYLIKDATKPPENDMAFYSEKVAYEWWIEYYAGDIINYVDNLDQADKRYLLDVWNDNIDLVEKVRTINKLLKGGFLNQSDVKLIRMKITQEYKGDLD